MPSQPPDRQKGELLPRIAATLSAVTERLAREVAVPEDLPPDWDNFEWRIAQAAVAMQGVSSQLLAVLRWNGPAFWQRFLGSQREHIAARHIQIAQLLDKITSVAADHGVAFVPLKGAALHALGLYEAGERPMADIDILVRPANANVMTELLQLCGYDFSFDTWRHRQFDPRVKVATSLAVGEHRNNPIKIELHTAVLERLPCNTTDITQYVFPSDAQPGINAYATLAALMMHLLLHAAGNVRSHSLRLIQLHDIATLARRLNRKDWENLLDARPSGRCLWWAYPPLRLVTQYFPGTIPAHVTVRLEAECPRVLRWVARRQRLTEVSWSNLKIHAFPGIEWCRNPEEVLQFVFGRIWPSSAIKRDLKRIAVLHPGASEIPWYGISQSERVLRWLFTRPPRVQTLAQVYAALAQRVEEPRAALD